MSRIKIVSLNFSLPFLALFLLSLFLYPGVYGGIKGRVTDNNKNPLDGVRLTITYLENPVESHTLKTNKKGEFIQIGLIPGYYQIKCEKDGYEVRTKELRVPISQIVEAELALSPSETTPVPEQKIVPGRKEVSEGNKFFELGDYEEAIKAYQGAVNKNPSEPSYYYNLGITYMRLEKIDEAIETFKKMIEIQPESFSALKSLGELYGEKKDFQEASKYFALAVKLSSDDPEAFYNLGVSLLNRGDYPGAVEAFLKSISCDENYADSHYQLGLLYLNQNRLDEAFQAFEKFLKLKPGDLNAPTAQKMIELIRKQKKS